MVLVSGAGTNLQALLDARPTRRTARGRGRRRRPAGHRGADARPRRRASRPSSVALADHPDRDAWDAALTDAVAAHEPDLVVSAGFMKLVGPAFLARVRRPLHQHATPRCCPSFPGMHGPRDALALRRQGHRVHAVRGRRAASTPAPIIAQARRRRSRDDDDERLAARAHQGRRARAARRRRRPDGPRRLDRRPDRKVTIP